MIGRLSVDEMEYAAERAAVREFDGGLDRDTAERAALSDVIRERTH